VQASVKSGKDCRHIICYKAGALPTIKKTAKFVCKPRPDVVRREERGAPWRGVAALGAASRAWDVGLGT
jgi:hypothetical protein